MLDTVRCWPCETAEDIGSPQRRMEKGTSAAKGTTSAAATGRCCCCQLLKHRCRVVTWSTARAAPSMDVVVMLLPSTSPDGRGDGRWSEDGGALLLRSVV
jgi:hypothetical protein